MFIPLLGTSIIIIDASGTLPQSGKDGNVIIIIFLAILVVMSLVLLIWLLHKFYLKREKIVFEDQNLLGNFSEQSNDFQLSRDNLHGDDVKVDLDNEKWELDRNLIVLEQTLVRAHSV